MAVVFKKAPELCPATCSVQQHIFIALHEPMKKKHQALKAPLSDLQESTTPKLKTNNQSKEASPIQSQWLYRSSTLHPLHALNLLS